MSPDATGKPELIGLDWGTSRLRVMLLDAQGRLIESRESEQGIRRSRGAFAQTFMQALAPWQERYAALPIYASGMITSRNGWVQTPYLSLPAGAQALAHALTRHVTPDSTVIAFVPGLRDDSGPYPDVMRGEETEITGFLAQQETAGADIRLLILPGTHTKWVRLRNGAVTGFRTCMTGELYGALTRHTILGDLMPPAPPEAACSQDTPPDIEAYERGLEAGRDGRDLLARLFSARTLALCEGLHAEQIGDYLSGLLISSEVAQMRSSAADADGASIDACTIIGRGDLAQRYQLACRFHRITAQIAPQGAAGAGLAALHARVEAGE